MVRITCCAPVTARDGKYGIGKCLRKSYKDDFKATQQKYKMFYFNKPLNHCKIFNFEKIWDISQF